MMSSLSRAILQQSRTQTTAFSKRALVRNMASSTAKADVVVIGCGVPGAGMGAYHAKQLLEGDIPSGRLSKVIEPWLLGAGAKTPAGEAFAKWQKEISADPNHKHVQFHTTITEGCKSSDAPWVALVSARTAANPALVKEALDAGCAAVYLEKPGAESIDELAKVGTYAEGKKVPVFMGYNKNVCKYVRKAREFAATAPAGAVTTFVHNNAYADTDEALGECFERNREGILKNMAIHELALLVSFYGVTVDTIKTVKADPEFSDVRTLKGPSGKEFTDFARIGFEVTTKDGTSVRLKINRCGGAVSWATVEDQAGKELFRHTIPDKEDEVAFKAMQAKMPDYLSYLLAQHDDYVTLKERICALVANGTPVEGVADVNVGLGALALAEYLQPVLMGQLQPKSKL